MILLALQSLSVCWGAGAVFSEGGGGGTYTQHGVGARPLNCELLNNSANILKNKKRRRYDGESHQSSGTWGRRMLRRNRMTTIHITIIWSLEDVQRTDATIAIASCY